MPDGREGHHLGIEHPVTQSPCRQAWAAIVESSIRDRCSTLGIDVGRPRSETADGVTEVTVPIKGRDPAGHATDYEIIVHMARSDTLRIVLARMQDRLKYHVRVAERVMGHPPVTPSPDMPLGHLLVHPVFVARLRMDHGEDAAGALRAALWDYMVGGRRRLSRQPRPYNLAMDANRVDHRETLGPGVHWKGRCLVLEGVMLPDQLLAGMIGGDIASIVDHAVLANAGPITRATCDASSAKSKGVVTIVESTPEWVRGDLI